MNSQAAEDFHAALLAMQEIEAEQDAARQSEDAVSTLVDRVYAFLDAFKSSDKSDYEPIDRLAA